MSYLDKKYTLDVDYTVKILNKYIKPNYENLSYNVRQSDESYSIYIELNYRGVGTLIRLSDHPDPNKHLIFHYVGRATKVSKIVSIVKNRIKRINTKLISDKIREEFN